MKEKKPKQDKETKKIKDGDSEASEPIADGGSQALEDSAQPADAQGLPKSGVEEPMEDKI
jgi:hypothetical protein